MKKISLVLVLVCAGCATNVGRAFSTAFEGTPPEVVEWVQFADKKMGRELRMRYAAVEKSRVVNSDGSVNIEAAQNRFNEMASLNAELDHWENLCKAHADYLGVSLDEPLDESEKRADKRRKELFKAIYKGAQKAVEEIKDE